MASYDWREAYHKVCRENVELWERVREAEAELENHHGYYHCVSKKDADAAVQRADDFARKELAAAQTVQENVPVKYFRRGGITYAVYGASSLDYVSVIQADLKKAQEQIKELEDGSLVNQRLVWLEHEYAAAQAALGAMREALDDSNGLLASLARYGDEEG